MEIRTKKTKSGNTYKFVNESWSNSNGWGHKTTIIRNSYDYEPHKVRYYNRTWESYTFQTCMSGAVNELREKELQRFIDNYKYSNNIDRFKKGQKQEVEKLFEETEIAQDLKELKEAIRDRKFSTYEELYK